MKPQLGDTIIHRYVLVSPLREAPGIQVWKANDQVLDRYCQLFIVTDASAVEEVNGAASLLVTAPEHRCTPILHIHHPEDGAVIVVTEFDPGVCLTDYLDDPDHGTVGYDAIRSIVGDTAYTAQHLLENGVEHHALGTDTIRVSADGIQFADTPVSVMYQDMDADIADRSVEERLVYQVASVLYRLLTHTPYTGAADALDALPEDTPYEFRLICARGLRIGDQEPLVSLRELMALLGSWVTVPELGDRFSFPTQQGRASIELAEFRTVADDQLIDDSDIVSDRAAHDDTPAAETLPDNDASATDESDESEPAETSSPRAISRMAGIAAAGAAAGSTLKNLWDKGKELLDEGIDSGHHDETAADPFTSYPAVPAVDPDSKLTVPIDVSAVRDREPVNPFEETSRIPIINADGTVASNASDQALEQEQSVPDGSVPPSFTPKQVVRAEDLDNDDVADATLFGRFTTKTVAIVAAAVLLVVALLATMHALSSNSDPLLQQESGQAWPEFDPNVVPFGNEGDDDQSEDGDQQGDESKPAEDQQGDQSDESKGDQSDEGDKSDDESKPAEDDQQNKVDAKQEEEERKVVTDDKQVSAMPEPRHENNTAFNIESRYFIDAPGQNGYGYAIHLSEPQDVYRMTITIRTSGGKGYIRANTADPTNGEQIAEFSFAEGGTTEVKFDKLINTQDLLLWVPIEDLPQGQLYIDNIEVF